MTRWRIHAQLFPTIDFPGHEWSIHRAGKHDDDTYQDAALTPARFNALADILQSWSTCILNHSHGDPEMQAGVRAELE
eukprot:6616639-Lingulodinium_polyedra.AAC.1